MSNCRYVQSDVCVPLYVPIEQTTFAIDGAWVAGAFFLGLFIGALIAALVARPCLRECQKKKKQDEEEALVKGGLGTMEPVVVASIVKSEKVVKATPTKKKKKGALFKRGKKGKTASEDDDLDVDVPPGTYRGMVDVMVQTTSVEADRELTGQDVQVMMAMEQDLDTERETLLLRVLDSLMKKQVVKDKITEDYYTGFMKRTEEDVRDVRRIADRETQEAQEELRNNTKLSKDSQAMEAEMQKLQIAANNRLSKLQRDQREKMRVDLIRSSGLSEAEVEALMEKLMGHMAALEEKLGQEQARQRRNLEERLAKRRQVMEYNKMQEDNQVEDLDARINVFGNVLTGLVSDGRLVERQREEVMRQYEEELRTIRAHYATEALKQQESLAEKLRQRRQKRMHRQAEEHAKERATLTQTTDRSVGTGDFIKKYHELVVRQHREREDLGTELDQSDIQEMDKMKKGLQSGEVEDMDHELDKHISEAGSHANLSDGDASRLLRQHQYAMDKYHTDKQRERQAMMARLQETLAHRLQTVAEQEQVEEVEMETLREQQTSTLNKVLSTNIELTQEARERILKEHEQNMLALSNQLQRSKMRQQKSLEAKMSERRARLEDLRKQQEELKLAKRDAKQKEKNKLQEQMEAEIRQEEEKLEAARVAALTSLRAHLAAETEEALRQQDEEIGLLIGRLQVGQARRQAILKKQDKTLKELQDQLEQKMTQGVELPRSYTDQLIQQHHNQVSHLNDHIQRNREKQERIIMEKLQTKKHMKENQLETEMEEEAQMEYYNQQQRGAGLASNVLLQTLLEQRHEKAMKELDTEMKVELERSKEELNTNLELELQQELESQKQQFLTQLAAISGISHDDLHDAVDAAATETGMSDKRAKKMAKDLRAGVQRAKSSLGAYDDDDDNDDYGLQRTRTDPDGFSHDLGGTTGSRPGSKKKKKGLKKPKPAFAEEDYGYGEGDDDF